MSPPLLTKLTSPPAPPVRTITQQAPPSRVALPDLMTADEVAQVLRVHPNTLRTWRHEAYGPAVVMIGRYPRYDRAVVAAWVRSRSSGGTA